MSAADKPQWQFHCDSGNTITLYYTQRLSAIQERTQRQIIWLIFHIMANIIKKMAHWYFDHAAEAYKA